MTTTEEQEDTSLNSFFRTNEKRSLRKVPVPDTIYEHGRLIGWKWTHRNIVKFLRTVPDYDPFAQAEGYYFDVDEWYRIISFVTNEACYPEGELTGKSFIPEVWQSAVYANLFCWKKVGSNYRRYKECFIYVPRKNGKELCMTTPIPTPKGFTPIGELAVGDTVFDKDGKQCQVVFVAEPRVPEKTYTVTFSSGHSVEAGADHQWHVFSKKQHPSVDSKTKKVSRKSGVKTVTNSVGKCTYESVWTTQEMFDAGVDCSYGKTFNVKMHSGIECDEADLPVNPYILGAWLGDGSSAGPYISVGDQDLHFWSKYKVSRYADKCPRVSLSQLSGSVLSSLKLKNNKHIPEVYFTASRKQRLHLLQGLMDTDGTINKTGTCLNIIQKNKTLADGIVRLCYSLGLKASITEKKKQSQNRTEGTYYDIQFSAGRKEHEVFRLLRKLNRMKPHRGRSKSNHIVSIVPSKPRPMTCIQVSSDSGTYLFGEQYLPTHNTTAFGAVITLLMFFYDKEQRSQNFCCAADVEQASVNFRHTEFMIQQNPNLLSRLKDKRIYKSTRSFEHNDGSVFKVLSSVADTKHGLSPNFVYVDEVHAHTSGELIDVMKTGTASRRQPLTVYTTTADYDRPSVCNQLLEKARAIRDNRQVQPSFLPIIYEALPTDDFRSPVVWSKANPNFRKSITEEYFEDMVSSVQNNPQELNRFLRLHLNIQTKTETAWIPSYIWARGNPENVELLSVPEIKQWMSEHATWNNIALDNRFYESSSVDVYLNGQQQYWSWFIKQCEELRDEECYAGFDNTIVQDLASLALFFPQRGVILHWCWCPAASVYRRQKEQNIPYGNWWESGLLNSTSPLDTTDDEAILTAMLGNDQYPGILSHFRGLREVCFDRFAARIVYVRLKEFGYPARAYPQNFAGMNEPCRKLEAMITDRQLFHGGNTVLEWEAGNVVIVSDRDGKYRPDKSKSTQKIDGVVASLMAVGGWLYPEVQTISDIRGLK